MYLNVSKAFVQPRVWYTAAISSVYFQFGTYFCLKEIESREDRIQVSQEQVFAKDGGQPLDASLLTHDLPLGTDTYLGVEEGPAHILYSQKRNEEVRFVKHLVFRYTYRLDHTLIWIYMCNIWYNISSILYSPTAETATAINVCLLKYSFYKFTCYILYILVGLIIVLNFLQIA